METGPVRFGRYTLLRRLDSGGMAEVFLARVQGLARVEKTVVIKRIRPELAKDPELVDLFVDEARISVLLRHGNIVPVFDFGKVADRYFLAMEYVDGMTLDRLLARCLEHGRPLPVELSAFIGAEICMGLHYAHQLCDPSGRHLQIVHRDVSPDNVMITFSGEVMLLDFGIARAANRITKTAIGVVRGKPSYLSPEQVKGLPVDARSDVFSAGILLYEMLTGRLPFEGDQAIHIQDAIAAAAVAHPSRHRPDCSAQLDRIVLRALARGPRDRYQSAAELGGALTRELYRLSPAFLPNSLASWVHRLGDRSPAQTAPRSGFEEALVRQLNASAGAKSPSSSRARRRTAAVKRASRSPADGRPPTGRWPGGASRRRASIIVLAVAAGIALILATWMVRWRWSSGPAASPTLDPALAPGAAAGAFVAPRTPSDARCEPALPEPEATAEAVRPARRSKRSPSPKPVAAARSRPTGSKKAKMDRSPLRGRVQLNSEPWADVYLKGEKLGHTPLMELQLPVGVHVLRLVNPRFGVQKQVRIEVRPDRMTKKIVYLLE